ncbi:trypsin-like serine protease, partial [Basidiobolus meristosporus CBS 931.73]
SDHFSVLVGSVENTKKQPLGIQRYIIHPDFDMASSKNDIALVELKVALRFDESIQPATMATELPAGDKNITTIGFGQTESHRQSSVLLKADLPLATKEFCGAAISDFDTTRFCTRPTPGVAPCFGDSGSP